MGLYINNKSVSLKTSRCDDITLIIPKKKGLQQWDRIDNKATVVGFYTDENNIKYAVCVADAAYRFTNVCWGVYGVNTPLPNYTDLTSAVNSGLSATAVTNIIKDNYGLASYEAFDGCYSKTLEYEGHTYHGYLPTAYEVKLIFQNKEQLDACDPTLSENPSFDLTNWTFGGKYRCWIAAEYTLNFGWFKKSDTNWSAGSKQGRSAGAVPVFEIPVAD